MLVIQKTVQLHPAQRDFRGSPALYRGFVGGRGAGKSWVGCYDLLRRARPGRLYLITNHNYTVLSDTTIRTFRRLAIEDLKILQPRNWKTTPHPRCLLNNSAEILFRSAEDPDSLRGPNLSGAFMDEASLTPLDAYTIVMGCLREGAELGWLSTAFTPKGLTHWTYEYFGRPRINTSLFHARTKDNPFGPPEFHKTLAEQYSGLRAQQELEGKFVNVEGAEWPAEYFGDAIWFDDWPPNLVYTALALDPSKGKDVRHGDYSAYVWGGVTLDGMLWVDADLRNDRPTPRIVEDGIAHYQRFHPQAFAIEVNAWQELLGKEFRDAAEKLNLVLPLYGITNMVNKQVRIRTLGPFLSQGKIRFKANSPGARLLVQQLRDFPVGDHDDGPDGLKMLVQMLEYLAFGPREGSGQPELLRA